MKNFLIFILLFFCALPSFAQEDFDYNIKIILKKDASAEVRETVTLYADSEEELPVLKRSLKTNTTLKKINLSYNMRYFSVIADKIGNTTFIQPVSRPFSRIGKNTITLSYIVPDAVYSYFGKDYFKFDLQLSDWSYKFKQGTLSFKVDGNHIINNTVIKIDNTIYHVEEDREYILTPFLNKNIFLDFSFEGGFFDSYSVVFHNLRNMLNILPIFVTLFMIIYCYFVWRKYGKDPKGPFVTEYEPPKDITPAFAKYILNRQEPIDFSYVTITLINLAMKGYIKISKYKGQICCTSLKGTNYSELVEEDKIIYENLFAYSPNLILDNTSATYIQNAFKKMVDRMVVKGEDFFHANVYQMSIPLGILLLSFLVIYTSQNQFATYVAKFCFGISLVSFGLLFMFINNISPQYVKSYCRLMGFRQYMLIAEQGRVHFSNPFDKERLFCDYLPYAYAFGMEKQLIAKFKKEFDERIIQRYQEYLGSVDAISLEQINSTLSTICVVVGVGVAAAAVATGAVSTPTIWRMLGGFFGGGKK
ncbi:MAG: DUF2207 domain-containing protein [Elusimicrobiaceae bacterium]|nr:DUF2207 domain-containing protein [Elusimicrobiaceae bacterium]